MQKKVQIRQKISDKLVSYMQSKQQQIILFISTVVGLILRLQSLRRDFWHDEAFQVLFSQMPVKYILDSNDVHPPLFTLITKAMVWFTTEPLFLRLTILIISFMFALQFYITVKEMFGKQTATFAYFFLMLSPTFAFYSTEFRSYSFVLLLTVIQIRYFNRLIKEYSVKNQAIFIILSCLMMYSHYMAWLIIATQVLYLFIFKKLNENWGAINLLAIFTMPLVYYLAQTLPKIKSFWFADIDLVSFVSTFFYYITPPDQNIFFYLIALVIYLIILLGIPFFKGKFNQYHIQWVLYAFFPVCAMWLVSQFYPFFHHRYFLFGGIGIFVLAGYVVAEIANFEKHIYIIPLTFLLFVIIITPISYDTPLQDAVKNMQNKPDTVIHTSSFSMSPMRVYMPNKQHLLASELSIEQRFTAGGGVIMPEHIVPKNRSGFVLPQSFYFVTSIDNEFKGGRTVYEKDGLLVKKY